MHVMLTILFLAGLVVAVNALYISWNIERKRKKFYTCRNGDYKGQTHDIKDWRKIAIELAKNTKNSRINAIAKHGTDEDVIGLLYLSFGLELFDNEAN